MHGINIKIERAEKHMQELQTKLQDFFQTNPYVVSIKTDSNNCPIYYISEIHDVPIEIPLIIGNILQELRSSLDYLAYKLFKINTSGGNEGKHVYFPISDNLTKYNSDKSRMTEGMSQKAKDLIDTIQPYKEGNQRLWQLHKLNIVDKHRLLIAAGSGFYFFDIAPYMLQKIECSFSETPKDLTIPPISIEPADNLVPLKVGDVLFIGAPNDTMNPDMRFKFNVHINESGIFIEEPTVDFLQSAIDEVKSVIRKFEPMIV